ncbi:MAG: hypothetical protein ACKO4T_13680 [Planctomycetaceae bacterium]
MIQPPLRQPDPTPSQQAAIAKVAAAIARAGGVALLCGPQGVGTSTVLSILAAGERNRGRSVECRDLAGWLTGSPWAGDLPDIVLADGAHRAADGDLARLLASCRHRASPACLVLAGEGRLLTLVARDSAVEGAVHLRASLRPLGPDESRMIVGPRLAAAGVDPASAERVAATIHEIGGGIPAAMLRLADLAAVVASSRHDRVIEPGDVEMIHRRLSPLAA